MIGDEKHSYRFGSFVLNVLERQLLDHENAVSLTPKAFDLLVYLVRRAGHLVVKDELMRSIWPDSFVEEGNLTRTIHSLRKALAETDNNKFIETVPTKGYRFVAKIEDTVETIPEPQLAERTNGKNEAMPLEIDPKRGEKVVPNVSDIVPLNREMAKLSRRRTVLIGALGFILAVLVLGFWFGGNLSKPVSGFRRLSAQTNSGEAYQHYQQGRFLIERRLKGDIEGGLASFEKAIELDPTYAAAYVGKADAKIILFYSSSSHDDISQARSAINKAIELEETNSYAHTLLCRIKLTYDWDFSGAEKECSRAVELDPNNEAAQRELALLFGVSGRDEDALITIDKAIALAPTSFNKLSRGKILYYARHYDETIAQLQQIDETDPEFNETNRWFIRVYQMKKDYPRAFEYYMRQQQREFGASPEEVEKIKRTYVEKGWPTAEIETIDPREAKGVLAAGLYAQLGNKEKALEVLNQAFERRAIMSIWNAREPLLDPLRDDPRFVELLRRIGLK
jgi:DNA-binding winged helix-turn-helix (wHTH) protein/lipoprotein NlpI